MPDTTLLVLTGIGIPPYSARGLTQTLEPIGQASQPERTINGTLIDLASTRFRKYRSTISCSDQQVPSIDGIWPGAIVTIDCVTELAYPTGGTAGRTVVPGSERTESGFTFYRPRLTMMLLAPRVSFAEWSAEAGWSMDFEEV